MEQTLRITTVVSGCRERSSVLAKAKNVIVIFCAGAVSQLETWDYKPELIKRDGQPLPGGPAVTFQGPAGNLARPQYEFRPRGQTGKMVSEMIPHRVRRREYRRRRTIWWMNPVLLLDRYRAGHSDLDRFLPLTALVVQDVADRLSPCRARFRTGRNAPWTHAGD